MTRSPRVCSGLSNASAMRDKAPDEIDRTAANSSSFDRKELHDEGRVGVGRDLVDRRRGVTIPGEAGPGCIEDRVPGSAAIRPPAKSSGRDYAITALGHRDPQCGTFHINAC